MDQTFFYNLYNVADLNLVLLLEQEDPVEETEDEKEKQLLLNALERTCNNRSKATKMLKINRTSFYEKLRKYHFI